MEYQQEKRQIKNNIFNEMKICSHALNCPNYRIDFQDKKEKTLYTLYQDENLLYSYYKIPNVHKYHLKISYPESKYQEEMKFIKSTTLKEFGLTSLVILLLTILFSLYAMSPLRKAFKLTEEFIKDILHDFNTPISAIVLNVKMLPKTKENHTKVNRIEQSLETLISLQANLKNYLNQSQQEQESFDLEKLIRERVIITKNLYPDITFTINTQPLYLNSHRDAISRILDNVLSNAGKYNQKNGFVNIEIKDKVLIINDTGKGITNPQKIFDRFYKEHDRGLGIGLHIVKKLCDELNIKIHVESEVNVGTSFSLSF
jgi:signal transduction histidine kinase